MTRSIFRSTLVSYILSSLAYAVGPLVDGAVIGNCLGIDAVAAYGMVWPAILIFALVGGVIVNYILSSLATSEYIAAYSVQKSVISLISCVYLGVADTVWTLSSIYYSEEDRKALNSLQHNAFRIGENLSIIAGVILFLFAGFFARIYLSAEHAHAMRLAVEAVRVVGFTMPLNLLVYTFVDYLIGTKHLTAANIYGYFLECGCIAPLVWILVRLIGGSGLWFAGLVSLWLMDSMNPDTSRSIAARRSVAAC